MRLTIMAGMAAGSLALCLGATLPAQEGKTHEFTASLEEVLDWSAPLSLTEEKMAATWKREGFPTSPLYSAADAQGPGETPARMIRFGAQPYRNIRVILTALGPDLRVASGRLLQPKDAGQTELEIEFAPAGGVEEALTRRWPAAKKSRQTVPLDGGGSASFTSWSLDGATAVLVEAAKAPPTLRIAAPERAATLAMLRQESGLVIHADLDFLLGGASAWGMTADEMDRRFAVSGVKEQLFFQWLDGGRNRARFTRKPFSNVTAALSLLGGQVPVQEANLDFEGGKLTRATLSVYNRGDSGAMTVPEFDKLIQTTGRELGKALGVSPKSQSSAASAAIKSIGWLWTAPAAVALMEHNDINARAAKGASNQPEYLRLKLAPPQNRDWSLGVNPVGASSSIVSKASLVKSVRKTPEGAVYIDGIPMVDQGDKGYCVVASCQRLFEFYRIPCDQHQLAQLVGTTADGGTSSRAMEEGLNKIDNGFKTRFKAIISPGMDRRDLERLDAARFLKMVQDSVNEGIPLLWTLRLGLAEEIPPLSTGGQVSGGHMRLIIGYDAKAGQILFTDSWGAGHELKRMSVEGAFASTDGLYTLTPRSY